MGVLADLVPKAQPAIVADGTEGAGGTIGRSWKWVVTGFVDSTGADIDLTSVTATCKVIAGPGGTDIIALTATGGVGKVTITATKAATAAVPFNGTPNQAGPANWYLTLDDGTDAVQVWLASNSRFGIYRGV